MAQPNKPSKSMSSRLMNMKFMQRAGASPSSAPSTPSEPPSKRQRLSNGTARSTPSSAPRSQTNTPRDRSPVEESSPFAAKDQQSSARGETKWYLNIKEQEQSSSEAPFRIVSAGYSTLDAAGSAAQHSDDDENSSFQTQAQGRRSFGKFNRRLEKQQNPGLSSSDSSSDSEASKEDQDDDQAEDESDDPSGAKAMIAQSRKEAGEKARAERKAKRKAEKAESARLADDRRKKQVKLNQLTSISGSGGTPSRQSSARDMKCFRCGEKGHMQKDCPRSSQQQYRHG